MLIKTLKKQTTNDKIIFIFSIITTGALVPVVVYCCLYPEELVNLIMPIELIFMLFISIYNNTFCCDCECLFNLLN